MPRIPDRWLKSVVHLYFSSADALAGEPYGGTAFLVAVKGTELPPSTPLTTWDERTRFEEDSSLARSLYVVTADHNIRGGATAVRFTTVPATAGPFILQTSAQEWRRRPEHDLAVLPVELDTSRVDFDAVPATRIEYEPAPHLGSEGPVRPGDDVFMVGRFVERSGRPHNEVQVRFGNVSMLPGDPINTSAGGLVAYLAEMRSRSGFSGSPVFVFRPSYGAVLGGSDGMQWAGLLGIDHGAYTEEYEVRTREGEETNLMMRGLSPLAVVVPSARLADLLMDEEFVKMRKENQKSGVQPGG